MELLISTEYWLSFYNDSAATDAGRALFKCVEGVEFGVLPYESSGEATPVRLHDAMGELCIRGPPVMRGYSGVHEDVFVGVCSGQYLRTKDVVRVVSGRGGEHAIEFGGRSDAMVKVGAEFVSLAEVERRLETLQPDGLQACVLPSCTPGRGSVAHASVAACQQQSSSQELTDLLRDARIVLPHGTTLHVLSTLPRDPVTGKLARGHLLDYVNTVGAQTEPMGRELQKHMLVRLLSSYPLWSLFIFAISFFDSIIFLALQWASTCPDPVLQEFK